MLHPDQAAAVLHKNDLRVLLVLGHAAEKVRLRLELLLFGVFVQSHFHSRLDVHLFERLENVAVGLGQFGLR